MITTKCPNCQTEVRAPDTFLGKKVRCKNSDCGKVFQVAQVVEPETFEPLDDPLSAPLPPEWEQELAHQEDVLESKPAKKKKKKNAASNSATDSKYPNLELYLGWTKSLAIVALVLSLIAAFIIAAAALGTAMFGVETWTEAIATTFIGFGTGLITALVGYLAYVLTMAGVELVRVIIDIEANTRMTNSVSPNEVFE